MGKIWWDLAGGQRTLQDCLLLRECVPSAVSLVGLFGSSAEKEISWWKADGEEDAFCP